MIKMLGSIRCGVHAKHWNCILALPNNNILNNYTVLGQPNRHYSKKDDNKVAACCKEVSQTEGKKVEPWPKHDAQALPPWRCECSREPQPPNYDPYRIKVPDVVVPPLPPSKAKGVPSEDGKQLFGPEICLGSARDGPIRDLFHNSSIVHPDYWKEKPQRQKLPCVVSGVMPRLGYHGRHKYMYAFHEPWKPLDRLTLLADAEKEEAACSPTEHYKDDDEK